MAEKPWPLVRAPSVPLHLRGLRLAALFAFEASLPDRCATRDALAHVLALTAARRCAWYDLAAAEHRGRPRYFISHAWGRPLRETLRSVASVVAPDALVWFDLLCLNQHRAKDPSELRQLAATVERVGALVLVANPWHAPASLARVWCLYELLCAQVGAELARLDDDGNVDDDGGSLDDGGGGLDDGGGVRVTLCLSPEEARDLCNAVHRATARHGAPRARCARAVRAVRVEAAQASLASDRQRILRRIDATFGVRRMDGLVRSRLETLFNELCEESARRVAPVAAPAAPATPRRGKGGGRGGGGRSGGGRGRGGGGDGKGRGAGRGGGFAGGRYCRQYSASASDDGSAEDGTNVSGGRRASHAAARRAVAREDPRAISRADLEDLRRYGFGTFEQVRGGPAVSFSVAPCLTRRVSSRSDATEAQPRRGAVEGSDDDDDDDDDDAIAPMPPALSDRELSEEGRRLALIGVT